VLACQQERVIGVKLKFGILLQVWYHHGGGIFLPCSTNLSMNGQKALVRDIVI